MNVIILHVFRLESYREEVQTGKVHIRGGLIYQYRYRHRHVSVNFMVSVTVDSIGKKSTIFHILYIYIYLYYLPFYDVLTASQI